MVVPLSNEDIHQALKSENGFRGVYSYDLLPNLRRGQFCVVNTDNILPVWDRAEGGHHWQWRRSRSGRSGGPPDQ